MKIENLWLQSLLDGRMRGGRRHPFVRSLQRKPKLMRRMVDDLRTSEQLSREFDSKRSDAAFVNGVMLRLNGEALGGHEQSVGKSEPRRPRSRRSARRRSTLRNHPAGSYGWLFGLGIVAILGFGLALSKKPPQPPLGGLAADLPTAAAPGIAPAVEEQVEKANSDASILVVASGAPVKVLPPNIEVPSQRILYLQPIGGVRTLTRALPVDHLGRNKKGGEQSLPPNTAVEPWLIRLVANDGNTDEHYWRLTFRRPVIGVASEAGTLARVQAIFEPPTNAIRSDVMGLEKGDQIHLSRDRKTLTLKWHTPIRDELVVFFAPEE